MCGPVTQPSLGGLMHILSPARHLQRLACTLLLLVALAVVEAAGQSSAPPAVPDEGAAVRAKRLDALFASLKTTKVEEEADTLVAEIWRVWLQSGNAEVDAQMQQAVLLMGSAPAMAMPILDNIVAHLPDWAEGWNKRATVLYLIGEYDRSLADCDRVLALEPRHFGALAGIGLIRIQKDEPRGALAAFRKALAVNPFLKERLSLIPELERRVGERPL
jgi:tetratricopeptide (TPR) repeat protein